MSRLLRPAFQRRLEHDECSFSSSAISMPARTGLASNSDTRQPLAFFAFLAFIQLLFSELRPNGQRGTTNPTTSRTPACWLQFVWVLSPIHDS
jgi:hypothetical protein